MGLFGKLFHPERESLALIDIGSRSVGVGFAYTNAGKNTLLATERVPITPHDSEDLATAMLRALNEALELLLRRGSSVLRQATGSGSVDSVFISLASPWEKTSIRIDRIDEVKPFTFTRSLMEGVVAKTSTLGQGAPGSEETVIATILNGYETHKPFGKEVKRADIVVLSTSIEPLVGEAILSAVRAAFHTSHPRVTAFGPLAYTVFRDVYPHEKEFLIVDVSGSYTDIAFVKQNLLMSVMTSPFGVNHMTDAVRNGDLAGVNAIVKKNDWQNSIIDTLKVFSEGNPLPRTLFLLADDDVRDSLRQTIDDPALRALWLSDEPLSIIPVLPSHFAPFIASGSTVTPDVFLMLLALFHGKQIAQVRA